MNMLGRVAAVYLLLMVFHVGFVSLAWANFAGWIVMLLFEVPLLIRQLRWLASKEQKPALLKEIVTVQSDPERLQEIRNRRYE